MNFVPLHLHTHYSLFEGMIQIQPLAKKIKEFGFTACAITDHQNLHGAISFYNELKKENIKSIIGQGFFLQNPNNTLTRFNLLCQNRKGYQNIIKLSTKSYLKGKIGHLPTLRKEWLSEYAEGLFFISGELESDIATALLKDDIEKAKNIVTEYQQIFGNRFFLEVSNPNSTKQKQLKEKLLKLTNDCQIEIIATNPCFYLEPEDSYSHLILRLMGKQQKINEETKKLEVKDFYLKSLQKIQEEFIENPEFLKNTIKIADACELDLENKQFHLPQLENAGSIILDKANKGLQERLQKLQILYQWNTEETLKKKNIYQKRLDYELQVITDMGYEGYFLIVADFVNFAKKNEILVGPGRGSAAGSLVAYSLKITNIDPLEYNLLFERFLNPARKSMPDIDIDFESENREKIIEYIKEKYGKKRVAQISTLGRLQAKAVLRGVARVLDYSYTDADNICSMIPPRLGVTLKDAINENPDFSDLTKPDAEDKELLSIALKLESLNSNLSTHAAGIVIMDTDIEERIPLCSPKEEEEVQIQYTMEDAEKQGAVKFDILGLKNLTIIRDCLIKIRKIKPDFDLEKIRFDDISTYQLLALGLTKGVFQLESDGIVRLIRKMKPTNFEDIIALIALYRPGPLGSGMVDDYINRKNLLQKTEYIHPRTVDILSSTYGVMVYQEQIIRIVQEVAGYSPKDADIFRRAMGKKDQFAMDQQRAEFIKKCQENKISEQEATEIFSNIDKFAGYGFNKSHSAAYAIISYQTAYLKRHYSKEFYLCLLNNEIGNQIQIKIILEELNKTKIKLLLPSINHSYPKFTLEGNSIRYGFTAIKGIGTEKRICYCRKKTKRLFKSR